MPRTSKFKLDKNKLNEINSHLTHMVSSLTNKAETESFLENFFTKEEKVMLAKRLVLFMMLKKKYSPSIIKDALHLSYETVRIYQNQFESKNDIFQKTIEKLIKRQESQELFKKINKILKPIDLAIRSRNDMRARAKFASGDWTE